MMAKIWLPQGMQLGKGVVSIPSFFYSIGTMGAVVLILDYLRTGSLSYRLAGPGW